MSLAISILGLLFIISLGLNFWLFSRQGKLTKTATDLQLKIKKTIPKQEVDELNNKHQATLQGIEKKHHDELENCQHKLAASLAYLQEFEEILNKDAVFKDIDNKLVSSTTVINNLKEEVEQLLGIVTTFDRWHDGLTELKANNKHMHKLNDAFKNIGGQTSILSLNASIEASKSGDAGRGFKVVAQEISQLAHQTQVLCARYADELHKNDLLTTATFQDTQAGSRMVLTAVDAMNYIVKNLYTDFSKIKDTLTQSHSQDLLNKVKTLREQITEKK